MAEKPDLKYRQQVLDQIGVERQERIDHLHRVASSIDANYQQQTEATVRDIFARAPEYLTKDTTRTVEECIQSLALGNAARFEMGRPLYDRREITVLVLTELLTVYRHRNNKRGSGEAYSSHTLAASENLVLYQNVTGLRARVSALLHDDLEDLLDVTKENLFPIEIYAQFLTEEGDREYLESLKDEIVPIVDGMSKIEAITETKDWANNKTLKKLYQTLIDNSQIVGNVKAGADRVHNMVTLEGHRTEEKRVAQALETLNLYFPLAGTLGIDRVVDVLARTCALYLNPDFLKSFEQMRDERREAFIEGENGYDGILKQIIEDISGAEIQYKPDSIAPILYKALETATPVDTLDESDLPRDINDQMHTVLILVDRQEQVREALSKVVESELMSRADYKERSSECTRVEGFSEKYGRISMQIRTKSDYAASHIGTMRDTGGKTPKELEDRLREAVKAERPIDVARIALSPAGETVTTENDEVLRYETGAIILDHLIAYLDENTFKEPLREVYVKRSVFTRLDDAKHISPFTPLSDIKEQCVEVADPLDDQKSHLTLLDPGLLPFCKASAHKKLKGALEKISNADKQEKGREVINGISQMIPNFSAFEIDITGEPGIQDFLLSRIKIFYSQELGDRVDDDDFIYERIGDGTVDIFHILASTPEIANNNKWIIRGRGKNTRGEGARFSEIFGMFNLNKAATRGDGEEGKFKLTKEFTGNCPYLPIFIHGEKRGPEYSRTYYLLLKTWQARYEGFTTTIKKGKEKNTEKDE